MNSPQTRIAWGTAAAIMLALCIASCSDNDDTPDGDEDSDPWSEYEYEDNAGRWVVNGDGTVTDSWTGRMWQQDVYPPASGAQTDTPNERHCNTLILAGYDDWRLPSLNELRSLVAGCPGMEEGGGCQLEFSQSADEWKCTCDACQEFQGPGEEGRYYDPDVWNGENLGFFWTMTWAPCSHAYNNGFLGVDFRTGEIHCGAVYEYVGKIRCIRN